MKILVFTATHVDDDSRCVAFLTPTNTSIAFYGPSRSPMRSSRMWAQPEGGADAAQTAFIDNATEMVEQLGYETRSFETADTDTDLNTDATSIRQWWATHPTTVTLNASTVAEAVALWTSLTATTAPVAPSTVAVADRPATLDATETVYVRPNGEPYLPRDLGGNADVEVLRLFRNQDRPIHCLLTGPAGSGKTAMVEAAHGHELVTMNCDGQFTVARMVGQLTPTMDGGWTVAPGPLTVAMENGWPLLLDEINKLPGDCITLLHAATDGRGRIRFDDRAANPDVIAKPGFCVIGTLNPDDMGGKGLPEAVVSRLSVQIEVSTDWDAARAMGVPSEFVAASENLQSRNQQNPTAAPVWVPQMRELLAVKRLLDAGLSSQFAAQAELSQCPRPEDVPYVADALSRALGFTVTPLRLGAQL